MEPDYSDPGRERSQSVKISKIEKPAAFKKKKAEANAGERGGEKCAAVFLKKKELAGSCKWYGPRQQVDIEARRARVRDGNTGGTDEKKGRVANAKACNSIKTPAQGSESVDDGGN